MATIDIKNVYKSYDGENNVVKDLNLSIEDKEFVVLVGPSGCGKSTTLRMIAGLEEITKGEMYIDDLLINDVPSKDRDIAMVFQNYALYPHMTVYENMAFGLKLRKFKKNEIELRVNEASEILGIKELLARRPKELSGGQKQRVAVGRAIVRKPKVFLFDEPLSNLDAKLRTQMRSEISRLHKEVNTTMVYVTHDQTEAMTMADRIVIMDGGIVQQTDTPMNLYKYPANKFVAGFIGSPAMNFVEGVTKKENGIVFQNVNNSIKIALDDVDKNKVSDFFDKQVTLGIRPEHIRISPEPIENSLEADVELFEPMGRDSIVYLSVGTHKMIVSTNSKHDYKNVKKVFISIDQSKVHFFPTEK